MAALAFLAAAAGLPACISSTPTPAVTAVAAPPSCSSSHLPSGGSAVLVGASTPVDGGYVTDAAAWSRVPASRRAQLQEALAALGRRQSGSGCAQTASDARVLVTPPRAHAGVSPGPGGPARLVSDATAPNGVPPGCVAGPRGTTVCDTLYGFGQDTTPFTVSGKIGYSGTPACLNYEGGRVCDGWFGAWGADGTLGNGNTGSGIGTSLLAVMGDGSVQAEVQSEPTALYTTQAPAGQSSAVSVASFVTFLDLSLETTPDSTQCATTTITDELVTPDQSGPAQGNWSPEGCVDERSVTGRHDPASAGATYTALRAAQLQLGAGRNAATALATLESAALGAHQMLVATPHAGLPGKGAGLDSASLMASACPILNSALAPGTRPAAAFTCTQSDIPVWRGAVAGQSLVSSQLITTAHIESGPRTGALHLVAAFNTVDIRECWPAAACS